MSDSFTGALTGGLIDSPPDYAGLASKNEAQRQAIIKLGLQQINAIYGGGKAPFYSQASGKYDPSAQYFSLGNKGFQPYGHPGFLPTPGVSSEPPYSLGNTFDPLRGQKQNPFGAASIGTGGVSGLVGAIMGLFDDGPETAMHHFQDKEKKNQLFTGKQETFGGFTPDFYNQRAKAYVDYATPQLNNQFRSTQNAIEYGLANRGSLGGSAAKKAASDLQRSYSTGYQQVQDTGRSQAQSLQDSVEASKQQLISQLYQSANPAQGVQGALANYSRFQQPSAFTPLASAFGDLLNQYVTSRFLGAGPTGASVPYSSTGYDASRALPGVTTGV